MSRTYHHGHKWSHKVRARVKHLLFEGTTWGRHCVEPVSFIGLSTWNEPKWWRKMTKHKPHRARTRMCLQRLRKGYDPDDMVWPLSNKPWIYYW